MRPAAAWAACAALALWAAPAQAALPSWLTGLVGGGAAPATDVAGPCWPCTAVMVGMQVMQGAAADSGALGASLWPLMATFVAIGMIYGIATAVIAGTDPVPAILDALPRLALLAALFGVAGGAAGAAAQFLIVPALRGGGALGQELAGASADAAGMGLPAAACDVPSAGTLTDPGLVAAAASVNGIACTVHQATMLAYGLGSMVASRELRSATDIDWRIAMTYDLIGLMMMYAAFVAALQFALVLFESVLRLAVVACFAPVVAFLWMYPSLRRGVGNAVRGVMYAFLYLAMSGIGATVTAFLLYRGISLGLGMDAAATPTAADLAAAFGRMATQGTTINDPGVLASAIRFSAYALICSSLAVGVNKGIQGLAAGIAQSPGSAGRSLAGAVTSMVSTAANVGVSAVAAAGAVGGRALASGVGRLSGLRTPGRP